MEIAERVRSVVGQDVTIVTTPTNDNRSYHISSARIKRELEFEARRTIEDAVRDLVRAFGLGRIPNSMTEDRYYNIKRMQRLQLK
jgi:nucleoside-diphosphate-sugar epimerase